MQRVTVLLGLAALGMTGARAGEVTGRVAMPEGCSPAVSPAVVVLEPRGADVPGAGGPEAEMTLIRQSGLQFVPRVQAVPVGGTVEFTNEDSETHNVHLLRPGLTFSESMAPGGAVRFVPQEPGVVRVVCDVHSHMRAFVVVAASPWVAACDAQGRFRLRGVPAGAYALKVWHELGDGLRRYRDVTVGDGDAGAVALETIVVGAEGTDRRVLSTTAARRWPEVIDRIGMLLTEGFREATRPGGRARARGLAEDAYWVEFEGSGMEVAVRRHLGFRRVAELEGRFRGLRALLDGEGGRPPSATHWTEATRALLLDLARTAEELNRRGAVDGAAVPSVWPPEVGAEGPPPGAGDHREALAGLERAFGGVRALADRGAADDAASALSDAYFDAFEPLERVLAIRSPGSVLPLEARFNALRGELRAGLKGPALAARLDEIRARTAAELGRAGAAGYGPMGAALVASLVIVVREGVEIILLLTMLVALVAKTGQARALAAIRWGVGLAVGASLATALGLNLLVSAAQGRLRELLEGGVMLAAAGVLFYVSYWLISQ
ncbi:MAG TPA: FTR1 family protein, partial [Isosphaeraceae bacterium]